MRLNSLFKVLAALLFILYASQVFSQRKRPKEQFESFMKQQWLIGVNFGMNYSQAVPDERFAGFSSSLESEEEELYEKKYNDFSLPGVQAGLNIFYYYQGFAIGLQPNFRRMRFSYENSYTWEGSLPIERIDNEFVIEQRLDYFELPFIVKYDILQKKFKPFVSAGVFQSFRMGASKVVSLTQIDYVTGEPNEIDAGTVTIGVNDSFERSVFGFLGSIGVGYDTDNNVRMVLEFTYRQTFGNIVNPNQRYTENQLTSVGDIYDDMVLRNVSASIHFLFPLKYISPQFKSI